MKKLLIVGGIYAGIGAIAFGTAFGIQYKPRQNEEANEALVTERVVSDKQKMLNSLLAIKGFDVNGYVNIYTVDNNLVKIDLAGTGDLSDLSDVKVNANLDVNINETHLKADLSYFDSEIYLNYRDSKFLLATSSVMDFVELLPTYGFNLELPESFKELNLNSIESLVENELSDKMVTPDGQNFYFEYALDDGNVIKILTDLDLNFEGIKTDTVDYKGTLFSFDIKLDRKDEVILNKPVRSEYRDFKPFFTLFDGFYNLTKKRQNDIAVSLNIDKYTKDEDEVVTKSNFLKTNLDLVYDLESENHVYALKGELDLNNKKTNYDFALANKNLYAHYGDIALSISNENLSNLLEYVLLKIGTDKITDLLSGVVSTTESINVTEIIEKATNVLGPISLTEDQLAIDLRLNGLTNKVDLSDVTVLVNFSGSMGNGKFESLVINDLRVGDFEADVTIAEGEYTPYNVADINYQKLDYLLPLVDAYEKYSTQDKFRIEFDGNVSKENEKDITFDGGLQFELDPLRNEEGHINVGNGYGEVNLTDRKDVKHNIYADMKSVDEILLRYKTTIGDTSRDNNVDPMYAKMKIQTLTDVMNMVTDIVKNPDDHFKELFGSVLGETMPIMQIIDGDYLKLLSLNIVDRLEIGENYLEADIALDVINFNGTSFTLRVEFDGSEGSYANGTYGLKALKIYNLEFEGMNIEFNAYLKDFKEDLATTRLSPYNTYMDFSDLKVLLQFGINTSKNNYYKFSGDADVTFALGKIDIPLENVGLDVRVWTYKGDVKVSVELSDVPLIANIPVVGSAAKVFGYHNNNPRYDGTDSRSAAIYYHDGNFFVKRIDNVYNKSGFLGLGSHKNYNETFAAKYNVNYFLDNAIDILCSDVLCLSDKIMEKIHESMASTSSDANYQMKYENILKNFVYSEAGHYFLIDLNLAELANNPQLSNLALKVFTDNSNTNLTGLDLNLGVSLLGNIGIRIGASITLVDKALKADETNKITTLEDWLAIHEDDVLDDSGKYISITSANR